MKTIVWFRNDLRLADNPALSDAVAASETVIPVFIWCPDEEGDWPLGSASRWWLHHSLTDLTTQLQKINGRLVIRKGPAMTELLALAKSTGVKRVVWNRRYERFSESIENAIKVELGRQGIEGRSFNGSLIAEPWEIKNGSGDPYRIFTPYWRVAEPIYRQARPPLPAPKGSRFPREWPKGVRIDELQLLSKKNWENKLSSSWSPGERSANTALAALDATFLKKYDENRNFPSLNATSRLSPHLRFGEVSPRQILHQVGFKKVSFPFIRQLAWREFSYTLLHFFPQTPRHPLQEKFKNFPWRTDEKKLIAWKKGLTGYPIVDAGMRELWETGTMHNRVRMIVGSFLVKDLLISWTEGAKWFWDTLVDADLANNTMGWQWVGGSGADAAPYFRIFNPTTQAERFDPTEIYIKKWLPDYKKALVSPIVNHEVARKEALNAYKSLR